MPIYQQTRGGGTGGGGTGGTCPPLFSLYEVPYLLSSLHARPTMYQEGVPSRGNKKISPQSMKCPTSTGVHARPTMYQEGVPRGAIIFFLYVKCPLTPVPPHSRTCSAASAANHSVAMETRILLSKLPVLDSTLD